MKIAVDFDGTCVTHEYPEIGKDIGAEPVLQALVKQGHKIILNTTRSGPELEAAVNWFKVNGIELYGINEDPGQKEWTQSPKVFANIYIDDAALGCPLKNDGYICARSYVDWEVIGEFFNLINYGALLNPCPDPILKE